MIKIALLDDDEKQRKATQSLLEDYAQNRGYTFKISIFASGSSMLNVIYEHGTFDLYILDILMPDKNGIDIGRELRKMDPRGTVVYLTSSPDFALESYEIRAFHYLLKPVSFEMLAAVMDEIVSIFEKQNAENIPVKTKSGIVLVAFDQILYAELYNRAVRYALMNQETVTSVTFSGSFKDMVDPLLADKRFRLCGASFLLNLHYIKMVEKAGVLLTTGKKLALPKSACANLRIAWADYWLPPL